METYLKITDLSFSFGQQTIFLDANLTIDKPGFYCLMGRNGCGKTTLFKLILDQIKPSQGSIEIIKDKSQIGYCMADPILFDNLNVYENLKLISDDDKKIEELAEIFNVSSILKVSCKRLSAGEKQRICLIRAIIEDKPIILLDEATSHLDDHNSTKVLDFIKEFSKTHVVIYSTHYEYEARKYADAYIKIVDNKLELEIVSLNEGKVSTIEDKNYFPKKLFNKITHWKLDYIFSALFSITICISMIFIWLLNLTPIKAYSEYEKLSKYPQYGIVGDGMYNPFDSSRVISPSNYLSVEYNYKQFVNDLTSKDNRYKKGFYKETLSYSLDDQKTILNPNATIDYVIFDDELEDNLMYISDDFYNLLVRIGKLNSSTGIANFYNTLIDFQCKLLDWGNFTPFYSYIICNKQTYKKYTYSTILEMKTTKSTTVNLTSGRLPESSNEIILNKNYYNEDEYGNSQFEIKKYGVTKTFDIVGYFDKQVSSLNLTNCSYLTSQEGYDFILDCDIYSLSVNYSAYVNINELTSLDYQNLIDNDKTIFNDVTKYAFNSYNYFSSIRRTTIVSVIFIGVFDLFFIIFYLVFYNKENQENFNLLNILKKTKYVKKSFVGFKTIINIVIFTLGIILFFIGQNILSTKLLNELAYYFKGTDYYLVSSNLFISLFINDFMIYTIPLILIIQFIVFIKQIRRVTK